MDNMNGFVLTNRDRVLRAWEDSTELVRIYQNCAHEIEDDRELAGLFAEYAEDEAVHASRLLERLRKYENDKR